MAGLIDPTAEIDRLTKRIAKNESDIGKLRGKLGNENFVKQCHAGSGRGRSGARSPSSTAQNESLRKQLERVRRLGGSLNDTS